ncbi:unnamed protein product [Cuscuta campestris]|uniref:Pentacotripeptide-repeat region of PRORP domain-containing protein n=1 Tax=Cuscuta campestris TaxID=132261 RepID=A0A484NNF3_9ASTE|nr:unnamed protein product [Cuscuta campestris]
MKSTKISSSFLSHKFHLPPKSSQHLLLSSSPPLQIAPADESESETSSISSPLYNFLPDTENPAKTVDLVCSALKPGNLIRISGRKAEISGRPLTSSEISRVLLRCQSDSRAALSFFDWARKSSKCNGNRLDALNYCLMVHILAWSSNYSQAMEVLSDLVRMTAAKEDYVFKGLIQAAELCNWSPMVFDMLIRVYIRSGMLKRGFRAFRNASRIGFSSNVITINILLNALSQANHFSKCWEVYEEMQRIGVSPNLCTFNILIHSLCRSGDLGMVDEFMEKMEEEGFEPDIVTYNMLVDSYCKRGRLKDAVHLYYIMYKRGIPPDLITYTALISGFCKAGNVKDAHQLFLGMVHRGLKPDSVSYNTLLHGYCEEGMMHEAKSLLHDMIRDGVGPDDFSFRKLVEGFRKHGRLVSALNLILEVQKFGVSVSQDIHEHVVIALCMDNRPFAAKNLLDRMIDNGFEPNMVIYRELMISFCNCSCVDEALRLKDEMEEGKGLKLCLDTYRSIITCLCASSRNLEANSMLREMIDLGLEPDAEICRALVVGHCGDRNINETLFLLGLFARKYHIFDMVCYNRVLRLLGEKGDVCELMEFQEKMMKIGFAPNKLSCKYVVFGLQKAMKDHKNCI